MCTKHNISNKLNRRIKNYNAFGEGNTAKVSFRFPNFETCEHWAELIQFLSPPEFQDTKLWEQQHLVAKCMCTRMNQCNITHNILVKPAGDFQGQQLSHLKLGIIYELGKSGWAMMDISLACLHNGFHFYSHYVQATLLSYEYLQHRQRYCVCWCS
ncbi:uncharacterized protein ACA1_078340 [Acanthamoeba castellanii str. Neff]|uniref:Uncharacterized protein n=1 Tax=Acanthamoeba castellanii (strain ATCC 30010 / Neff) TaxID=1257118 RepID=L8GT44_ACACF|nr:uncharacterized protein ACA1_078340 [Acanthamoeba castellanii str. Neff]ELR15783.1 hypothetical protein ACA1_078340 [Acanthamoeba castellanii str. Neff]